MLPRAGGWSPEWTGVGIDLPRGRQWGGGISMQRLVARTPWASVQASMKGILLFLTALWPLY